MIEGGVEIKSLTREEILYKGGIFTTHKWEDGSGETDLWEEWHIYGAMQVYADQQCASFLRWLNEKEKEDNWSVWKCMPSETLLSIFLEENPPIKKKFEE